MFLLCQNWCAFLTMESANEILVSDYRSIKMYESEWSVNREPSRTIVYARELICPAMAWFYST